MIKVNQGHAKGQVKVVLCQMLLCRYIGCSRSYSRSKVRVIIMVKGQSHFDLQRPLKLNIFISQHLDKLKSGSKYSLEIFFNVPNLIMLISRSFKVILNVKGSDYFGLHIPYNLIFI